MTATRFLRTVGTLAAMALLATACGTQIDDEQRAAAIAALSGGDGPRPAVSTDASFQPDPDLAADTADQSPTGQEGEPGTPADTAPDDGSPAASQPPGSGTPAEPTAPDRAGGPLRATDVGVTAEEIVIANVADISGPIPGLFESVRQAVMAYAAYVNSRGGIHGRQLRVLPLDSRTDAGENRNATLQACEQSLAMVGSMSAFDMGGASAVDECGIPDITAIPVTGARQSAAHTYAIFPLNVSLEGSGPPSYLARTYPDAVKKAAMLYTDASTTRENAEKRIKAFRTLGFEFIYETTMGAVEPNMAPYVLEMRRRGVEFVTGVLPFQQIVRLLEAMRQQSFEPAVRYFDSVVYDPQFLRLGGDVVEGVVFHINTAMFEEVANHPEMQRYLDWLARTAPRAAPTYFGLHAWSAAALFEDAATRAGPELTRAALLEQLQATKRWDGRGLHPPHNIGDKREAGCFLVGIVRDASFARLNPASGWECGELISVE